LKRQVATFLPTKWGNFQTIAYSTTPDEPMPHLALVSEHTNTQAEVIVRIHSECMTGDVFGSKRCDCGEQLDAAMQKVAAKGGIIIYLRQEGRGIGLLNKLHAYNLQANGMNTADANTHLGFEQDARTYADAIFILKDLGIQKIQLLTNNPEKLKAFQGSGIKVVGRLPLIIAAKPENQAYFDTKKTVFGHFFEETKKDGNV
jgi:GTP cyclohydrolase II